MAIYSMRVNVIGRSAGRSATGAAAYRAGIAMEDERTGIKHDYTRKEGVVHAEIRAPTNTPEWMYDRAQLWNGVEKVERRKDAQLAREIMVALPHELSDEQRLDLVRRFVDQQCVAHGMIADFAIHRPDRHELADQRNHHAHILLTTRTLTTDGFGKKAREWNDRAMVERWRESWADIQNQEFGRRGLDIRVDHRSNKDRGIMFEPSKHLGPVATEIERSGRRSHAGNDNREIAARNGSLKDLLTADNVIDAKIEFEKRKFVAWKAAKRQKLRIDEDQQRAQFDVGLAARMMELEKQLDAEFAETKIGLSREQNYVADRLQTRGWRKFIRDITFTTRRDKEELDRLREEAAQVEKRENAKRIAAEASERARLAALEAAIARQEERLEKGLRKAEERRKAGNWRPLPSKSMKASAKAPAPPVRSEFIKAAGEPPPKSVTETERLNSAGAYILTRKGLERVQDHKTGTAKPPPPVKLRPVKTPPHDPKEEIEIGRKKTPVRKPLQTEEQQRMEEYLKQREKERRGKGDKDDGRGGREI